MSPDLKGLCAEALRERDAFRRRVTQVPYERKGILFSEMFFLHLCARRAKARRILESGRARGQSTLLLSLLFPDLPVISFEHDPDSPDVAVAAVRLAGRNNVDLRFGDATRLLPAELRAGDVVLIDGPKGFRGLRLALRLLATGRAGMVFLHDAGVGSVERAFLEARVPGALYSDAPEFARIAHPLDEECRGHLPIERRFDGEHPPAAAYGFGMACLMHDAAAPYRRLLVRAMTDGFLFRHAPFLSSLRKRVA